MSSAIVTSAYLLPRKEKSELLHRAASFPDLPLWEEPSGFRFWVAGEAKTGRRSPGARSKPPAESEDRVDSSKRRTKNGAAVYRCTYGPGSGRRLGSVQLRVLISGYFIPLPTPATAPPRRSSSGSPRPPALLHVGPPSSAPLSYR
ncbi:hypothetical protein KM043_005983 [Ampulex compressa]|nr:hypothetical protein KM043_005983 [Ampulex compressa]